MTVQLRKVVHLILPVRDLPEAKVEWLKRIITEEKPLVLIIRGDVVELGKGLGVSVYPAPADLLERFSIERVPVILKAEGELVKVEERIP